MFSDPQTVTVNTVANTLPRVSVGDRRASYIRDDETLQLTISHQATNKGRVGRMVRLDTNKVAADPFISGNNREVSSWVYLVVNEPQDGAFSNTELLNSVKGLLGWLSDANVAKLLSGES